MNLHTLSIDEFLRLAHTQLDDLTSSDIEREALRRLEARETDAVKALDETEFSAEELRTLGDAMNQGETASAYTVAKILSAIDKSSLNVASVIDVLEILDKAGITESEELETVIELADKFRSLANDAGDIFNRLHTLTEETQED